MCVAITRLGTFLKTLVILSAFAQKIDDMSAYVRRTHLHTDVSLLPCASWFVQRPHMHIWLTCSVFMHFVCMSMRVFHTFCLFHCRHALGNCMQLSTEGNLLCFSKGNNLAVLALINKNWIPSHSLTCEEFKYH